MPSQPNPALDLPADPQPAAGSNQGPADNTPWHQKTPAQKAASVTDHLAHEFASGNLRPRKQPT